MSTGEDWKKGARAEYLSKRADLSKKLAAAERAERKAGERVSALNRQLQDLEAGARAFGLDDLPQMDEAAIAEAISVRDGAQGAKEIILDALAERFPAPMKAKELKAVIEAKLGRAVHPKTPGMTLYRLAEDGLVRRDFHDWYLTDKGKLSQIGLSVAEPREPEVPEEPDDDSPPFDIYDGPDDPPDASCDVVEDDDDLAPF